MGANSFLLEKTPFWKGQNQLSPRKSSIPLKAFYYIWVTTLLSTSFGKSFFACKGTFCIEKVNLQTFSKTECKTICSNYLFTRSFIPVIGLKKSNIFIFSKVKTAAQSVKNSKKKKKKKKKKTENFQTLS